MAFDFFSASSKLQPNTFSTSSKLVQATLPFYLILMSKVNFDEEFEKADSPYILPRFAASLML